MRGLETFILSTIKLSTPLITDEVSFFKLMGAKNKQKV
jgi:hypothetical protein